MRSSENLDKSRFPEIASSLYLGVARERVTNRSIHVKFLCGQNNTVS
jgi:hypothetical protein